MTKKVASKIEAKQGVADQPCNCGFVPYIVGSTHQPSCTKALMAAVHGDGFVCKPALALSE